MTRGADRHARNGGRRSSADEAASAARNARRRRASPTREFSEENRLLMCMRYTSLCANDPTSPAAPRRASTRLRASRLVPSSSVPRRARRDARHITARARRRARRPHTMRAIAPVSLAPVSRVQRRRARVQARRTTDDVTATGRGLARSRRRGRRLRRPRRTGARGIERRGSESRGRVQPRLGEAVRRLRFGQSRHHEGVRRGLATERA